MKKEDKKKEEEEQKKKKVRTYLSFSLTLLSACGELSFASSCQTRIGAWSVCILTKEREADYERSQNVISIRLPLFFY